MALKVELKPNEKLIIGDSVITNADQRSRFYVSGRSPVLREKDILTVETADSPARRIYFAIQLMYLDDDIANVTEQYFNLINDLVRAAPSTLSMVDDINNEILTGSLYKALKKARKLINYEQELIGNAATGSGGIPPDGKTDEQSS